MPNQCHFVPALEPMPLAGDRGAGKVILVAKGSPCAFVFEHAHTLQDGGEAPLSLSNFPGWAIVPKSAHGLGSVPKGWFMMCSDHDTSPAGGLNFIEMGVGSASKAMVGSLSKEGLLRRSHDQRVLHVLHHGFHVDEFRHRGARLLGLASPDKYGWSQEDPIFLFKDGAMDANKFQQKSRRTWVVHDDGAIGPLDAKHLVLGLELPKVRPRCPDPVHALRFEHAADLRRGVSVPLTLASHPGYAIVDGSGQYGGLTEGVQAWHVGPASHALTARFDKQPGASEDAIDVSFNLITSTHTSSKGFVVQAGRSGVHLGAVRLDPAKYPTPESRHDSKDKDLEGRIFTIKAGAIVPVAAEYKATGMLGRNKEWRTHKGDKAQTPLPPSDSKGWGCDPLPPVSVNSTLRADTDLRAIWSFRSPTTDDGASVQPLMAHLQERGMRIPTLCGRPLDVLLTTPEVC